MLSLYELMDAEIKKTSSQSGYESIESVLENETTSAEFIKKMLQDPEYNIVGEESPQYDVAKTRARHSVITYLMGMVFHNIGNSFAEISRIFGSSPIVESEVERIWMLTSLYHDIGYFSDYLSRDDFNFDKRFSKYPLLNDDYKDEKLKCLSEFEKSNPHVLAFTYDEIRSYENYARTKIHNKPENSEKIDHGILGGFITLERLIRKTTESSSENEYQLIKTTALTIAQHNIFKAETSSDDDNYPLELLPKLSYKSNFYISQQTPLLLLLCLVDTIECVKKLSKGSNPNKYLETETVLKNLFLSIENGEIILDFTGLRKRVIQKNDDDLAKTFDRYIKSIQKIHDWTQYRCTKVSEDADIFSITLKNVKTIKPTSDFTLDQSPM